jgi:hypothetical protein
MTTTKQQQRIVELEREIRELEASLPAHSVPPSMLLRLEELEQELADLAAALLHPRTSTT